MHTSTTPDGRRYHHNSDFSGPVHIVLAGGEFEAEGLACALALVPIEDLRAIVAAAARVTAAAVDPSALSCPRCGERAPLGRYHVCAPCAAQLGWDPRCVACHAEGAGRVADVAHVRTCASGDERAMPDGLPVAGEVRAADLPVAAWW